MSKSIYVGNMSYSTQESDLNELFSEYGEVSSVKIISDRDSGRSKGFGFVEMANADDADKAISSLDGQEFMGRPLKINEAKEKKQRF